MALATIRLGGRAHRWTARDRATIARYGVCMAYRSPIETDVERIRTLFLQMCVRAESMLRLSVRSLVERDPQLARSVVAADRELDALELEVDSSCLRCLALRQPMGHDLRLVTMVMKMVTDIERIGDLAVNVSERGLELFASGGLEAGTRVVEMGDTAADMLRMAADAFVEDDASVAERLIALDRRVDDLNRDVFERMVTAMAAHPDQVQRALALTSVSKYLERAADHAVNVGEMVVFLVDGKDVRHRGSSR